MVPKVVKAKTPISRRGSSSLKLVQRAKRGFTLMEVSVVILILALLSAAVIPRVVAMQQTQMEQEFRLELGALVTQAQYRARTSTDTIQISFDEAEQSFSIESVDAEGTESVVRTVAMPETISIASTRVGTTSSTSSEWTVQFFSDGSCQGGAIELNFGGRVETLSLLASSGASRWSAGEMPAAESLRWQAGEIEQRQVTP